MHLLARLLEVVAALDRRVPRPERQDEPQIAAAAAELRARAVAQIGRLGAAGCPDHQDSRS